MTVATREKIEELMAGATDQLALDAASEPAIRIWSDPHAAAVIAGRLLAAAEALRNELERATTYKSRLELLHKFLCQEVTDCLEIAENCEMFTAVAIAKRRANDIGKSVGRAAAMVTLD